MTDLSLTTTRMANLSKKAVSVRLRVKLRVLVSPNVVQELGLAQALHERSPPF
jgi:hypothetical protein